MRRRHRATWALVVASFGGLGAWGASACSSDTNGAGTGPDASTDAVADADADAEGDALGLADALDAATPLADAADGDAVDAEPTEFTGSPITLATGQNAPSWLIALPDALYWVSGTQIMTLPRAPDGGVGAPKIFASLQVSSVRGMATDGTYLYVVGSPISSCPYHYISLSTASVNCGNSLGAYGPTSACDAYAVAADGTSVYLSEEWQSSGGSCSFDSIAQQAAPINGTVVEVANTGYNGTGGPVYQLAVSGSRVYFVTGSGNNVLESAPTVADGGSRGAIATLVNETSSSPPFGPSAIGDFVTDDTNVYWSVAGGELHTLPQSNDGGAPNVLAKGQAPVKLAVDARTLYWTNETSADAGSVVSLSTDGGSPRVLAPDENRPQSIAVDALGLYWTDVGDGTVRMLRRQ